MPRIRIAEKEICSANLLKVQVGTNCPQGGDAGHGGRTLIRLVDQGGTAMQVRVDKTPSRDVGSVEILFGGDSECGTLIEALQFALDTLKSQVRSNAVATEEDVDFQ